MTGIFCPQTLTFDPIAIHLPVIMGDVEKKKILTTSQERRIEEQMTRQKKKNFIQDEAISKIIFELKCQRVV